MSSSHTLTEKAKCYISKLGARGFLWHKADGLTPLTPTELSEAFFDHASDHEKSRRKVALLNLRKSDGPNWSRAVSAEVVVRGVTGEPFRLIGLCCGISSSTALKWFKGDATRDQWLDRRVAVYERRYGTGQ